MNTITSFAAGHFTADRNTYDLLALTAQMRTLASQLSTRRVGETYGDLGIGRSASLAARAQLAGLAGYDMAIDGSRPRVELTSLSLAQIAKSAATLGGGLTNPSADNLGTREIAKAGLERTLAALNQTFNGQYLFGGRESRVPPVLTANAFLEDDVTDATRPLAGLRTMVAEQIRADQGSGTGHLSVSTPSPTRVLVEESSDAGVRANFGFNISGKPTATGPFVINYTPGIADGAAPRFAQAPLATDRFRVVVNQASGGQKTYDLSGADLADVSSPAKAAASLVTLVGDGKIASVQSGTPPGLTASFANAGTRASFDIDVTALPKEGDRLSIRLSLHDGTTTTLTLRAQSEADPQSTTSFAIGTTASETARNLSATLQRALGRAAGTDLAASATLRATQDFFAGSTAPGLAPRRIDFTGPAPTYFQSASASTVIWYKGEASPSDPRSSFVVRAGATRTVAVGARADEAPLRGALSVFAALAVTDPSATTPEATERWKALVTRSRSQLPPGETLDALSNEFALASGALADAKTQNTSARAIIQTHLDQLETIPTEEVMVKLLDVQARLQASYQVTATLSKLSLVNYLR
ncbi:hypothetical protein CCR97_13740 [Rhodoplanes elegans]|uniref:Flagellin C-terminal domain-containing protein n=1 Tax=Rhodoplanes elegans TaxID=29408 RepID=A0A327KTP0_9BRAD|nr:hypothetical protein [Rhodoplanes elegans]MBK5959262.1 hypothetical protein [Rhodoplanes elegans]RAI42189.1 hypothetical protein CH338_00730 [Rhodoplanes elegans]